MTIPIEYMPHSIFEFRMYENGASVLVDGELAINVLVGNKGDRIGRTHVKCQNNFDEIIFHPESNKLQRPQNIWMFHGGGVRVYNNFRDQNVTLKDKRLYLSLGMGSDEMFDEDGMTLLREGHPPPELIPERIVGDEVLDPQTGCYWGISDESLDAAEYFVGGYYFADSWIKDWSPHVQGWEWHTDESIITALEDETIMVCIQPANGKNRWIEGWEIEHVDLSPGQEIRMTKKGEKCYLLTGSECSIANLDDDKLKSFGRYDIPKLAKDSYILKNTDSRRGRFTMVYKNV